MLRLGAHNSIAGGLHNAVAEAQACGSDAMQIFSKSQRQWRAKPLEADAIQTFKGAVGASGIAPVMVHDSYLINLGTPDPEKRAQAQAAFQEELERCTALGIPYLNFHPGSHTHPEKGLRDDKAIRRAALDRIAAAMQQTLDAVPGPAKLVVENAAGQGTNVGNSWEEVAVLVDAVKDTKRVGVCVDTQHAWACGYDWLGHYDEVWDGFEAHVGRKLLVAFHLNDSKEPRGSRVDRHDNIGKGHLGEPFFRTLLNDGRLHGRAGYLETEGGPEVWRQEIAFLRSLKE